jgi:putative thioredoxin
VIEGRPQPLIDRFMPRDQLSTALNQIAQQLTTQGIAGRHQPRHAAPAAEGAEGEEQLDPRYAPAQDALAAGDYAGAVAEYEKLLAANPADAEAAAGLAMATVLARTDGVDPATARAAADASPDDVAAQTLAADLDLLDGDADAAFTRLVELVRRSAGDERNQAREHLLGLFAAVGNDDPRVLKGRQALASALF